MKKQYEAVIEVMKENGGFATLGQLYQQVLKVPNVEWRTKTPFASIRRIVQDSRFFFKIKPGLWVIKELQDKLPQELLRQSKTNIQNSLVKFVELQDFYSNFFIIADKVRQSEFHSKILLSAFKPIVPRIKFVNYEQVSAWHTKIFEISTIENTINS